MAINYHYVKVPEGTYHLPSAIQSDLSRPAQEGSFGSPNAACCKALHEVMAATDPLETMELLTSQVERMEMEEIWWGKELFLVD